MTEQHPITPPPELVQELWKKLRDQTQELGAEDAWDRVITLAYRAGADQELDACCEWFRIKGYHPEVYRDLRDVRRPKPPSLAEQALQELERTVILLMPVTGPNKVKRFAAIRRALERLQELENND